MDFKSGADTDIDNIVQTRDIYTNINKGELAPRAKIQKAWPKYDLKNSEDVDKILAEFLRKGEYQVGEKERKAELERVRNEVIDIVANKVVDPKTNRQYPPTFIAKALDQMAKAPPAESGGDEGKKLPRWTGVVANKEAKAQALAAIKALVAHQPFPVQRARMRLRITCPVAISKFTVKNPRAQAGGDGQQKSKAVVKEIVSGYFEETQSDETAVDEWEIVGFIDPSDFGPLSDFVGGSMKGQGRLEVLDTSVVHQDD